MTKLDEQQKMIYDDLSMPEKVAILLIQLGEDATTLIFSHMDIDVITEISRYIASAKTIDKTAAATVLSIVLCPYAIKSIYEKWWYRIRKRNFISYFWS